MHSFFLDFYNCLCTDFVSLADILDFCVLEYVIFHNCQICCYSYFKFLSLSVETWLKISDTSLSFASVAFESIFGNFSAILHRDILVAFEMHGEIVGTIVLLAYESVFVLWILVFVTDCASIICCPELSGSSDSPKRYIKHSL